MAVWKNNSLSILTNRKYLVKLIFIFVTLILLISILRIFSQLEEMQAISINTIISSMLRDETKVSNLYLFSKSIEDLHKVNAITCAIIYKNEGGNIKIFYDSTYNESCQTNGLKNTKITGLDGQDWEFAVSPKIISSFYILKWFTIAFVTFLILITYYLTKNYLDKENKEKLRSEERRLFLENLTQQVHHDVASPLSALKIIAKKSPLDEATKIFLNQAISRTSDIFESLNFTELKHTKINIDAEIKHLVQEKEVTFNSKINFQVDTSSTFITLPATDWKIMISNLFNNAYESNATAIYVNFNSNKDYFIINIGDNANKIPEQVVKLLGLRGNTLGKSEGSGLGLAHAYNFMQSINGKIEIPNTNLVKIRLLFPHKMIS